MTTRQDLSEREPFPHKSGGILALIGAMIAFGIFFLTSSLFNMVFGDDPIPEPRFFWAIVGLAIVICNSALGGASTVLVGLTKTKWGSDLEQAKRYMDEASGKEGNRKLASLSNGTIAFIYNTSLLLILVSLVILNLAFFMRIVWIAFSSAVAFLTSCFLVCLLEDEYYINLATNYMEEYSRAPE